MAAVTSAASAAAARIGAALSDAQYFESSMVRVEDIRRQLDSRSVKDKLDAMKRVVALISLGKDASTFFPDVVKNVVAPSLDVKKMVYLYLVHYAEEKQDLALLAINSFQKDLSDHNQHIRALSLRVLSSIRVKVILQVVILAINKAAKDSSSYVRKAAAHAIGKVCALDSSSKDVLMEPLHDLVSDRSTQVLGSAIAAFEEVCPYNFSLIHPHYRRICSSLSEVDPWGQITIVNMLLRYARIHFGDPYKTGPIANGGQGTAHRSHANQRNPDLVLLLKSISPLFCSLNNSVVSASIAVYYHLASVEEFRASAVKPLMRLVSIEDDGGQAVALKISSAVAVRFPSMLIPYVSEFYVSASHSTPIRSLRMDVLTKLCAAAGEEGGIGSKPHLRKALLSELKDYLFRRDNELAASSARAIGCLATAHPGSTPAIVKVLSSVVGTANNPRVVTESIGVLRRLLQRHPSAQTKALPQLIAMLLASEECIKGSIQEPAARASIIWLLGEFYERVAAVACEALRLLARGFVHEAAEVKLQIINLAAKVVAWSQAGKSAENGSAHPIETNTRSTEQKLLEYIVSCARYDRDYDVRDKARMLHFLFLSKPSKSLYMASCDAFISKKPTPASADLNFSSSIAGNILQDDIVVGSLAHVMSGRKLPGFRRLEPWAIADSASSIRDEVLGSGTGAAFNREYTGVSSKNYQGPVTTTQVNNTVWDLPAGISSSAENVNGSYLPSGGPVIGMTSGSLQIEPKSFVHVDTSRFYDSGDGDDDENDSSEYDSSSAEEESDTSLSASNIRSGVLGRKVSGGKGLSTAEVDALVNTEGKSNTDGMDSKANKAPSEFDLDALLSGLVSTDVSLENKSAFSKSVVQESDGSPWQRVVESWKAAGLEIDGSFMRSASPSGQEVTPVILRITNSGNVAVSNVSFSSRSGNCFSSSETVGSLQPNESREMVVEARFRGKTGGVGFSVNADGKSIGTGELKPGPGYVMRPHANIRPGEFVGLEKSLCGMFASEARVEVCRPKNNDWMGLSRQVKEQTLQACFMSHIKTSVGRQGIESCERFSMLFAGLLPGGQGGNETKAVLVRITAKGVEDKSRCCCELWVGCEDVLFCANLMQVLKSAIMSIEN